MPKNKPLTDKEKTLNEFISLTWEAVRRNQEYKADYVRFTANFGLTPEDLKPQKKEGGGKIIRCHPGRARMSTFDWERGRLVLDEESPDAERCNYAYMMHRWGFACDPDDPTPQGAYWKGAFISKEWLKLRKLKGLFSQPLTEVEMSLKKLPGVLEVDRLPEFRLTDECIINQQNALRQVSDGWKPQNDQEYQEYLQALKCEWITETPSRLAITLNLQAPSYLILYALEFLISVCKADLKISDDKINGDMIRKCFEAWDLREQGASDEQIAEKIPVRKYNLGHEPQNKTPEMMEADREVDNDTSYKLGRINDYLEKAGSMIQKGAVI